MKNILRNASAIIIILILSSNSFAQMFSADGFERRRVQNFGSFVTVGFEPMDFQFQGDVTRPGFRTVDDLSFTDPIYRLSFENQTLSFTLGVAGRLTGLDDRSFINLGLKIGAPLRLVGTQRISLLAPFQLKTDVTNVQSDLADDSFQQNTFSGGFGGELRVRFNKNVRFTATAIPSYGFSVAQGGFFGGQVYDFEGKSRLLIGGIFPSRVVALGYNYKFSRFDIESNQFDYNLRAHTIVIGLSL